MADAKPKSVILDLRSHSGGLLDEAVAVAAAFLPPADVVGRLRGRQGDQLLRAEGHWRAVDNVRQVSVALKDVPIVVLVDEHTSAGAELVAGALQELKRARVVGRTTRGAGTVASILPVGDLAYQHMLKLPTAGMLTPNGRRIEGQGIVPDVRVDAEDDEQQIRVAERALAAAGR